MGQRVVGRPSVASSRPTDEERLRFNHVDPRRRREDLYINRIRGSNPDVFAEICRRFVRGDSVASVSNWLWHLRPHGYLRTYLSEHPLLHDSAALAYS
jgi:hypothetical protein